MRAKSTPSPKCPDCDAPVYRRGNRCRRCSMSRANRLRWQDPDDPRRRRIRDRNQSVRDGHMPYRDREWVRSRYEDCGMDLRQIARESDCALRTIARWMKIHNIPVRDVATRSAKKRGPESPTWRGGPKRCEQCGGARSSRKGRLCRPCQLAGYRGAGNPNWRGRAAVMVLVRQWTHNVWRMQVFQRDAFQCVECGDRSGKNLQAHHVVPLAGIVASKRRDWQPPLDTAASRLAFVQRLLADPDITSVNNGATLCGNCHRATHRR